MADAKLYPLDLDPLDPPPPPGVGGGHPEIAILQLIHAGLTTAKSSPLGGGGGGIGGADLGKPGIAPRDPRRWSGGVIWVVVREKNDGHAPVLGPLCSQHRFGVGVGLSIRRDSGLLHRPPTHGKCILSTAGWLSSCPLQVVRVEEKSGMGPGSESMHSGGQRATEFSSPHPTPRKRW